MNNANLMRSTAIVREKKMLNHVLVWDQISQMVITQKKIKIPPTDTIICEIGLSFDHVKMKKTCENLIHLFFLHRCCVSKHFHVEKTRKDFCLFFCWNKLILISASSRKRKFFAPWTMARGDVFTCVMCFPFSIFFFQWCFISNSISFFLFVSTRQQ